MIQIEDKTFENIIRILSKDKKLLAIKIVAACLNMNLKDSKEYVETLLPTNKQNT